MSKFFIAGNGGSGTTWLAHTLNLSRTHIVKHESADRRVDAHAQWFSPFPIDRWNAKTRYGECHGLLRGHLSPWHAGPERQVPYRYILLRSKRDLVRSWMNRDEHDERDLEWITYSICRAEAHLLAYWRSDSGCSILHLEDLVADTGLLQHLCDTLRLGITVTDPHRLTRYNAAGEYTWDWPAGSMQVYEHIVGRHGDKGGLP